MSKTHNTPRGWLHRLARVAPLIIVWALVLIASPALAQDDPNFAAIDDPLDGGYEVLPVDDLVIYRPKPIQVGPQTGLQGNNYVLATNNGVISTQTARTVYTAPCYLPSGRQPQQTRVGRFFNLPNDVMVTLLPTLNAVGANCATLDSSPNMALHIQDVQSADNITSTFSLSAVNTAVAMADFNQDGHDDLLIMSNAQLLVATAADVNNKALGMTFGPATPLAATLAARTDPTSGDFNDDGIVDVAWIALDNSVHFATVCPGAIAGTVCAGAAAWAVIVDPLQSRATVIETPTQPGCSGASNNPYGYGVALTAGNFAADGSDGLLTVNVGAKAPSTACSVLGSWWEFDANFSATQIVTTILGPGPGSLYPVDAYAVAAKLDWFGAGDQVVVAIGAQIPSAPQSANCPNQWHRTEELMLLSFTENKVTVYLLNTNDPTCLGKATTFEPYPWVNGMAVGHFASIPQNATQTDFNPQIATLLNNGKVRIYKVTNFRPALASTTTLDAGLGLNLRPEPDPTYPTNQNNWLITGDLQGRSMQLGPPVIVRVDSHSQPSVILGAPPMHVDYILPDVSTSPTAAIVNFTTAPDSYYSQYSVSDSTDKQSSDTNTTSYAYAYSESVEEKFKFKAPFVASISGDFKQAWKQTGESTSSKYKFKDDEFVFNAGTTTGFGDQVWYSSSDFNMYYYPVIGQTVTVTNADNSVTAQPLYVSLSGPSDSTGMLSHDGSTLEWYQPVHEPGQIFSYPWSKQQLDVRYPGIDLLTSNTPEPFFTDNSGTTETLNWSQNSGSAQTTGSSHSHSFETDNSVTFGSIPDGAPNGATVTGSFDYNNSTATSSLNSASSQVGQSQGIGITKPKFPTAYASLYEYLVRPFIFGQSSSAVQQLNLGTAIQTSGPLRSAYIADPTNAQAGSWWQSDMSPYTQYIDVALNHPQRWNIVNTGSGLACVVGDCALPYTPLPNNLWNSQWYHMRGLLVTVGGYSGPQRAQALVGDDIFLQARVYNYSFKDMPAGSMIHVRFYRQEIIGTTPTGDSVLIAEKSVNPLLGFNSATNRSAPNWTTVGASFAATNDMATKNFIFWVVVWVEQDGALVPELPGHGLTGLPGALATIGATPLEMTTITTAAGDVVQSSFSNNVGMFKQLFYIAPSTPVAASPLAASPVAAQGTLRVENVQVTAAPQYGRGNYVVSADIRAVNGAVEAVEVLFVDGDLEAKTVRLHDVDVVPFVPQEGSQAVSVVFRPAHCGANRLAVVARSGAANRSEQRATFDVSPCPPIYLPIIANN